MTVLHGPAAGVRRARRIVTWLRVAIAVAMLCVVSACALRSRSTLAGGSPARPMADRPGSGGSYSAPHDIQFREGEPDVVMA